MAKAKRETRTIIYVMTGLDVRYRQESWGEWFAVAWRISDGRWHSCESPRTAQRILGHHASHTDEYMETRQ